MEIRRIADQIFYLPATEKPLSADVGIMCCGEERWIFDVGASEEAAAAVNGLPGHKKVVLSHFHPDHTGNIASVKYDALYAGAYTCKKLGTGETICEHRYFENGIHLFPLPSSHAKGCVGLEYGGYAFLGDGTYSAAKGGRAVYNAGLLRELIVMLETLSAEWVLQSHREPFLCSKAEMVAALGEIYARRDVQEPYIFV